MTNASDRYCHLIDDAEFVDVGRLGFCGRIVCGQQADLWRWQVTSGRSGTTICTLTLYEQSGILVCGRLEKVDRGRTGAAALRPESRRHLLARIGSWHVRSTFHGEAEYKNVGAVDMYIPPAQRHPGQGLEMRRRPYSGTYSGPTGRPTSAIAAAITQMRRRNTQ